MKWIKTEFEEGGIKPDVKVDDEVYEVETLFNEGAESDLKITETIDKYSKSSINKVNIVMHNFVMFLHLKDLHKKKRHFKDKQFEVEIYTLDLKNKTLISLEEFTKKISNILDSIKSSELERLKS